MGKAVDVPLLMMFGPSVEPGDLVVRDTPAGPVFARLMQIDRHNDRVLIDDGVTPAHMSWKNLDEFRDEGWRKADIMYAVRQANLACLVKGSSKR